MKIAFVGDSFCANATVHDGNEDWPYYVAERLDADIIQSGHGGQHFFHSVIDFLPKLSKADIIIFCISEPNRIINDSKLPINFTWVEQINSKEGTHWHNRHWMAEKAEMPLDKMLDIAKASQYWYDHLHDWRVAEFMQVSFISFVDDLMKQHKKKVIWLPCFNESLALPEPHWDDKILSSKVINRRYIPISGPMASIPLHELSQCELKHQGMSDIDIRFVLQNDERRNHFNAENNVRLGVLVLSVIRSNLDIKSRQHNSWSAEEIKMDSYFTHMNLDKVKRIKMI